MSEIILMPLIKEGAEAFRPVEAEPVGDGAWQVLGPVPYGDTWAFLPGTLVCCERRTVGDEEAMVAVGEAG